MMSSMVRTINGSKYGKGDIIVRRKSHKQKTTECCMVGANGFPNVKSYCRECRGTTGKVVGGTETHWDILCDCGQHWKENKISFAQKYVGLDGRAPEFSQREPQQERNWKDEPDGSQIRQMQDLLKDFNLKNGKKEQPESKDFPMATVVNLPAEETSVFSEKKEEVIEKPHSSKIEETQTIPAKENVEVPVLEETSEKENVEVEENESLVTFEVAGIKVSFREGITVTVHRVDGQVNVVIR